MTQISEAKRGITTSEAKFVSKKEGVSSGKIRKGIATGRIVLLKNSSRKINPVGIGEGLRVKVNANIGTSIDILNISSEIEKAIVAARAGADTLMDLSTAGNLSEIRKKIMQAAPVPLGTVPIYETARKTIFQKKPISEMDEDELFRTISSQLKEGTDFITVHSGITRKIAERMKKGKRRLTGVVSRGGAFLVAWMLHNGKENPLNRNFDYLLEIAKEHDAVLSLGDGLRPGSLHDAGDYYQFAELKELGKLQKRALKANVQSMIEGPGHVPISEIANQVKMEKKICNNAPFYVLGPLVCDVGAGYDHITAAIGGAIAAMNGADFLCYVTPSEHVALPTVEEVREGVVATKIAAHSVDLLRFPSEKNRDFEMSKARVEMDWEKMFNLALDGEKARKMREERTPNKERNCTMCGDLCSMDLLSKTLGGKKGVC